MKGAAGEKGWTVIVFPEREYVFHPERKWRLDFAWPEQKVAVELEGGIYAKGGHTSVTGFIRDCDKYNALSAAGWRLFRFTEKHLTTQPVQCCELVATALAGNRRGAHPMRISPAAVLAACRQFPKCKVVTCRFGDRETCGCPLTLLALSLGLPNDALVHDFLNDVGYGNSYLVGFCSAIDNVARKTLRLNESGKQGYADGTATRELLVREGVLSDA